MVEDAWVGSVFLLVVRQNGARDMFFEFIADQCEAALFLSCDDGAGGKRTGARLS